MSKTVPFQTIQFSISKVFCLYTVISQNSSISNNSVQHKNTVAANKSERSQNYQRWVGSSIIQERSVNLTQTASDHNLFPHFFHFIIHQFASWEHNTLALTYNIISIEQCRSLTYTFLVASWCVNRQISRGINFCGFHLKTSNKNRFLNLGLSSPYRKMKPMQVFL